MLCPAGFDYIYGGRNAFGKQCVIWFFKFLRGFQRYDLLFHEDVSILKSQTLNLKVIFWLFYMYIVKVDI